MVISKMFLADFFGDIRISLILSSMSMRSCADEIYSGLKPGKMTEKLLRPSRKKKSDLRRFPNLLPNCGRMQRLRT